MIYCLSSMPASSNRNDRPNGCNSPCSCPIIGGQDAQPLFATCTAMTQTIIYHLSFIQLQMDLGLTSGYKYNLVADEFVRSR